MKETKTIRPKIPTGLKIKTCHSWAKEHTHVRKLHLIGLAYMEEVVNKTF